MQLFKKNVGVGLKRSAVVFPIQRNDARGAVLTGSGLKRAFNFPELGPWCNAARLGSATPAFVVVTGRQPPPPRRRLAALVVQQGGRLAAFAKTQRRRRGAALPNWARGCQNIVYLQYRYKHVRIRKGM